jgi:hypothetical protein
MNKIFRTAILLSGLASPFTMQAQTASRLTDPFDQIFEHAAKNNPNFRQELGQQEQQIAAKAAAYIPVTSGPTANKTTGLSTVPVVFHVVLNSTQLQQMGGTAGVITRIQSQLDAMNEDFNAANTDSTQIPAAFKPLYGNMGVHFGLAHTDPNGHYTPGYEFVSTTKTGFDANYNAGTTGSTNFCSDAKYASSGGADAWDPTKYLNIWIINITPNGVGGVGTPPPYAVYGGTQVLPWAEQGVALAYGVLGKRTSSSQYFLGQSAVKGRALVHELGHFFNLFHTFGISTFNNSNCQDDDGVSDTPPQVAPSFTATPASFPLTDGCSPNAPGVMFMNHMDYTSDTFRVMFSTGQRARSYVEIDTGGYRHSLFLHPNLLNNGSTGIETPALVNAFSIYPNPAHDRLNISFNTENKPGYVVLINQVGQSVRQVSVDNAQQVSIGLDGLAKGLYFVRCYFNEGTVTEKVLVQ